MAKQTNTPDFASILDQSPTEVNRPKSLPTGTYTFIVGDWEQGKSSQKKTPFVKFSMKPVAADADVDEDELEEALTGADGEANDIRSKTMSITFYTTADAIYRLDEFHEHCGIDLSEAVSRATRNDMVLNAEVK